MVPSELTAVRRRAAGQPGSAWLGRRTRTRWSAARWRIGAGIAFAVFAALIYTAVPGSVDLVRRAPATAGFLGSGLPQWAKPCLSTRYLMLAKSRLAFCARADGRVIASFAADGGETHLLVAGGLHLTLVELRPGMHTPRSGSRIVAVGPLGSSDGLRELRAVSLVGK